MSNALSLGFITNVVGAVPHAFVPGNAVTLTRPNNVTAYAAGVVYGPAADARFSLVAPAVPVDCLTGGFTQLMLFLVQNVVSSQGTLSLVVIMQSGLPATVLGDQANLALSDADIGNIIAIPIAVSLPSTAQLVTNPGAGTVGRRMSAGFQMVLGGVSGPGGIVMPAGTTVGGYLMASAAYTPLAVEAITIIPQWGYVPSPL